MVEALSGVASVELEWSPEVKGEVLYCHRSIRHGGRQTVDICYYWPI